MIYIRLSPERELYLLKLPYQEFLKELSISRLYGDIHYIKTEREKLRNTLNKDKVDDIVDYVELIDEI